MNSFGKFGVGLLVGVLLVGFLARDSSDPEPVVTVAPVAAEPIVEVAPWLEDEEIRIGSALILPRGLEVNDGAAVFRYELAGLSPSMFEQEDVAHQGDVVAAPEHWMLTTTGGASVEQSTTGPGAESVRFELPDPDDEVATIDVVGWREARTRGDRNEMPLEVGATAEFSSGTVTIETVLEQRFSTIVQFDLDEVDHDWRSPAVLPLDTRWRVSGRQDGGMQLLWDGVDAPATVTLEDGGLVWRAIEGEVRVLDRRDES